MSWESTVTYYQIINDVVKQKLGGLHSAKVLLYSVDFYEVEKRQADGDWVKSAAILSNAAQRPEKAGADFIIICTTMHKVATEIPFHINIPVAHIADATAKKLKRQTVSKIALLGTKHTMIQNRSDNYKRALDRSDKRHRLS